MKQSVKDYKRIVVKIGSSLLYPREKLDTLLVRQISRQVSSLIKEGRELVIVSSGAIAVGMSVLKLENRPKKLSYLQAAAAVGQPELMDVYRKFMHEDGIDCAQILLTWEDFSDRKRYLNAKNTLSTLLEIGILPVINENDTVSTEEIKFGDNDRLSALVAALLGADLLIILSDVDGLLDQNKNVIKAVDKITSQIKSLACPTTKKTCVGGMVTKIEAAKISVDSGIPCIIANGRAQDIIKDCIDNPEEAGTLFSASENNLIARKRWIAFGAKPKGKVFVDAGAKSALLNKKSLLSVGIVSCEGNFSQGDVVSILGNDGVEFARARAAISSKELEKAKGIRYHKEAAHRDNIVIL